MAYYAETELSPADFHALAATMDVAPIKVRKNGFVAARQAEGEERIVTKWNGEETVNETRPGDWIVTNLAPTRKPMRDQDGALNTYVIRKGRFEELYEPTKLRSTIGAVFRPKTEVLVLYLQEGFDILAPWGERQQADEGYLVLSGDEVYGNNVETFKATYRDADA